MRHFASLLACLLCLLLMLCPLLAACGEDAEVPDTDPEETTEEVTAESIVITLPENPEDYSIYAGIWLCGAQYDYDYMKLDTDGNWELYVGNDMVDSGYLKYVPEWECVYAYSNTDGSGCQFRLEGEELYTASYGYFSRADGMVDIHYESGE